MIDPKFKCPFIKKELIWQQADIFRKEYWPENSFPVNIELIIEKNLNLPIIPLQGLSNIIEGFAFLHSDRKKISVDKRMYDDIDGRYDKPLKFAFAHEIGHLVLHENIYKNFNHRTIDEYIKFMDDFPEDQWRYFESQANQFAGRLLISRQSLIDQVNNIYFNEIKKHSEVIELLVEQPEAVLYGVSPKIGSYFGVSGQVAKRRIEEEELWPPPIDQ